MSRNTVEELLAQLFTDDTSNSSTYIVNNIEESEKTNVQYIVEDNSFQERVVSYLSSNSTEDASEINDSDFIKLFRMKRNTVINLQRELEKASTERPIVLDTNLLLCLWIIGSTVPMHEMAELLGITENHLITICEKFCKKIIELSTKYIVWPTVCEMSSMEKNFKAEYEFPSVIGAIGCLHITVQMSERNIDCSEYFNMNSSNYTIVLQAVCDSNLLFRDIFVGHPGGNSVETILKASPLNKRLNDENSCLRRMNKHLLGGTEHPQLETLLTPYPVYQQDGNRSLSQKELEFNSMHSAAMLVVDKTFHAMENRFQRMKCLDSVHVEFATVVVAAICVLHNFTRIHNDLFVS